MADVCTMLSNAIDEEYKSKVFYEKLYGKLDKDSRWKLKRIIDEEFLHSQEMIAIRNRLGCSNRK